MSVRRTPRPVRPVRAVVALGVSSLLALSGALLAAPAGAGAPGAIRPASVALDGTVDEHAFSPLISGDGRHVAFYSSSSDLVAGDTNDQYDVFVRDLDTGTTTLVSRDPEGRQFSDLTWNAAISGDGRYVAFQVDDGGASSTGNVYVRDLVEDTTTALPIRHQAYDDLPMSISDDGDRIAFTGGVYDRSSGVTYTTAEDAVEPTLSRPTARWWPSPPERPPSSRRTRTTSTTPT